MLEGSGAVRFWRVCAFWSVFAIGPILWLLFLDELTEQDFALNYRVFSGLVALFSAQAFLAEAIGIRANARKISFPRRLFPHFGFPTLWRRRIALKDILRTDSLDERTVRFFLSSTELVDLLFPDSTSKRSVLRYIDKELARSVRPRPIAAARPRGRSAGNEPRSPRS
jgi:hypothetical protein